MTTETYAELFKSNGSWIVRYTSQPEKQRVIELMGTNEIPTPFTTKLSYEEVAAKLRAIPANRMVAFVEACA